MFRRALVAATGMGATIALCLSAGSATASPVAAEKPDPAVSKPISKAAQEKTKDYWTSSRMKNAKSGDLLVRDRDEVSSDTVAKGEPTVVRGSTAAAAKPQPKPQAFLGGYYTGGGKVVQTTGKVFFTLGGTNYVCSGSSTVAANNSLVQTAGHCLNEGPGAFATNFTFVPALRRRRRPVRPVRRRPSCHLHAVGQPGRPQLRHRLRGGRHVRRLDAHRRRRCPGRRVQPRPQRHDVRLRLPGRVAVRRHRHRLVQRAGRGRHVGRQLRPGHGVQHDRRLVRRTVVHQLQRVQRHRHAELR